MHSLVKSLTSFGNSKILVNIKIFPALLNEKCLLRDVFHHFIDFFKCKSDTRSKYSEFVSPGCNSGPFAKLKFSSPWCYRALIFRCYKAPKVRCYCHLPVLLFYSRDGLKTFEKADIFGVKDLFGFVLKFQLFQKFLLYKIKVPASLS